MDVWFCIEQEQSPRGKNRERSEEHTSELQSQSNLVCRLLLEKKKTCHDRPGLMIVGRALILLYLASYLTSSSSGAQASLTPWQRDILSRESARTGVVPPRADR